MFKMPDIPSYDDCKIVNPRLFLHFQRCYMKQEQAMPGSGWNEADVVQWLDTQYGRDDNKYIHETLVTDIR